MWINLGYMTMDDGTHVPSFSSASGLSNLFSRGVLLLPVQAVSCAVHLSLCLHLLASLTTIPSTPRNPSLLFPFTILHLQNQSLGTTSRLLILGCSWGHHLYPECHFRTCNKKKQQPISNVQFTGDGNLLIISTEHGRVILVPLFKF